MHDNRIALHLIFKMIITMTSIVFPWQPYRRRVYESFWLVIVIVTATELFETQADYNEIESD